MGRYRYSLVRCVPEPRTGEFINIGAIAGAFDEGDWSARSIGNYQRALRLCTADQIAAVTGFIAEASQQIEDAEDSFFPLRDEWLDEIASERRNVVQLTAPQLAVAESADQVLDLIFARQLIDLAKVSRPTIGKHRLVAWIRRFMSEAISDSLIIERPRLTVGEHVTTTIDFAFGSDRAVALTQAWSFQKEGIEDLSKDVKAWAYAMERVRNGEGARLVGNERSLALKENVPIEVVFAPPLTPQQQEVFEEAKDVFNSLDANIYGQDYERLAEDVHKLVAAA
jgi:hypothetical protein